VQARQRGHLSHPLTHTLWRTHTHTIHTLTTATAASASAEMRSKAVRRPPGPSDTGKVVSMIYTTRTGAGVVKGVQRVTSYKQAPSSIQPRYQALWRWLA
jgi:hypothetical protein